MPDLIVYYLSKEMEEREKKRVAQNSWESGQPVGKIRGNQRVLWLLSDEREINQSGSICQLMGERTKRPGREETKPGRKTHTREREREKKKEKLCESFIYGRQCCR